MNGQTIRLANLFRNSPMLEIPAIKLHPVGAGKDNGFCASLSRRISDLRKMGMNVEKTRDEYVDGQRQTAYTYFP